MSAPPVEPLLWPGARWFDDWFAVEAIDAQTYTIAEPRYWQYQACYLLMGDRRALLFDSGSGKRDITPVVASLTDLPVTVACSHSHFDHLGNHARFDCFALPDHPDLRARIRGGTFCPSLLQHLKFRRPRFSIHEWWAPGEEVDLGRRILTVIPVPGHAPESIALLDRDRGQLFLGDFLYNGELYVVDPVAYLQSLRTLDEMTTGREILFGSHGFPRVPCGHLVTLAEALQAVRAGRISAPFTLGGFLLTPQRRIRSADLDVRLLYGGRVALFLPIPIGAALIATGAALFGVLTSPVLGALAGLLSLIGALVAYEQL